MAKNKHTFKKLAQNISNAIWQRLVSWMASDARDHSPLNLFKKKERAREETSKLIPASAPYCWTPLFRSSQALPESSGVCVQFAPTLSLLNATKWTNRLLVRLFCKQTACQTRCRADFENLWIFNFFASFCSKPFVKRARGLLTINKSGPSDWVSNWACFLKFWS